MKKIFFIIGIATFSFASAQQNGKPYFKITPPKSNIDTFFIQNGANTFSFPKTNRFNQVIPQFPPLGKLYDSFPNGNKVYSLPQDHMPCVVPDMSQYNNMAVVKPNMPQYNIPNPAYPPQNKNEPLTPEKLKELWEHLNKK